MFSFSFEKFDFFYEQKVRFDLDEESKLCLTPQQFAEKLAKILSEKKINDAASFVSFLKLLSLEKNDLKHLIILNPFTESNR